MHAQHNDQGLYPTLLVVVISLRTSVLERTINNSSASVGVSVQLAMNGDSEAQLRSAETEKRKRSVEPDH